MFFQCYIKQVINGLIFITMIPSRGEGFYVKSNKVSFYHRQASHCFQKGGADRNFRGVRIFLQMNTSRKEIKKERGAYFPLLLPVSHTDSLIKRLMNLMLLTYDPQTSLFQLIFQYSAIQQNVYCATLTQTSIYCRKLLKFTVLFSIQKNSMLI